ncbi:phage holin family protein [Paraburkholderia tropica]|uniref:HP1 family phage holin n=1 Tax=Paraburkholderia tropica TaxID=92647 RepID=UPI002AB23327|nr:HP1 family phage holin [Paraburkholderia tropica]
MKITTDAAASYGGAVASLTAGLTLQDIGVWIGIITALVTCFAHIYFSARRADLEERVANARIAEAQSHTAQGGAADSAEPSEASGGGNG